MELFFLHTMNVHENLEYILFLKGHYVNHLVKVKYFPFKNIKFDKKHQSNFKKETKSPEKRIYGGQRMPILVSQVEQLAILMTFRKTRLKMFSYLESTHFLLVLSWLGLYP